MAAAVRPAATLLSLVPTGARSFAVLMLQRHSKARFMANTYVFPGGCVDAQDTELAQSSKLPSDLSIAAHRVAVLREFKEETGCVIDGSGALTLCATAAEAASRATPLDAAPLLVPFAHWITPVAEKYRYDTWFFLHLAPAGSEQLKVFGDRKEVVDHLWVSPSEALALQEERTSKFRMPPPTYIMMHYLRTFATAHEVIDAQRRKYRGGSIGAIPTVLPEVDLTSGTPLHIHITVPADGAPSFGPGSHDIPVSLPLAGVEKPKTTLHVMKRPTSSQL